jgi:hypothetical protein
MCTLSPGDNETQLAANSNQLLETISYTSDTGTFDYTVEEINNVLYTSKLAQFTITINRAGITSPKIDDIEFKYTPDYYTAPSVPLNVATANADKRSVDLTWEAPVDDGNNYNSFYIEAKFADQDGWEDVVYDESESEGTTSTNIVLPRLGEDYIIRIQVENNYGESDWVELEYSTPEPEVFHITDCEELQAINDNSVYWGDTYILDNNIDCSDSVSWNSGAGFIPIAFDNADDFTGMLDGQGFTISDLYINQPDYEDIGLFSELEYATVTNVNFTGAEIVGYGHAGVIAGSTRGNVTVNEVAIASETSVSTTESGYVGGLFGYYDDSGAASTITDVDISATLLSADDCNMGGLIGYADAYSGLTVDQVHTTVDITGECSLGGLIGRGEGDITVTDTQTEGTIDISYEYGGGLFGEYNQGEDNDDVSEMTNNSSSIDLTLSGTESENIGGLFGYLDDGSSNLTFNKNFATGDITQLEEDISAGDIGGLIGEADEVVITNAYATGDVYVPSADAVGGLVGYLDNSASLDNTYASGDVTGIDEVGGLVGSADGEVSDSFAVGMVSGGESEISVAGLVGDGYVCTEEDECNPGESFELTNSYYDKPSTGQDLCYVAETYDEELDDYVSAEVDGCTTTYNADRYFNPANAPLSSWNFDTVWGAHQNSYPDFELGENPVFPDDDNDGVDDEVESEAPNNGDANNDGTPDSEQANVASYINSVTGSYSVVETSCGSNFNVQDGAESVSDNDAAYDYPAGLVGFVGLSCGAPGSSVTVNLFYYGDYSSSDFVLRKWNSANAYSVIDGAALENVTIDGKKALQASYTVVDGGELDQDGVADGNIRDPAGPAVLVVGSPNTGL